MATGTVPKSVKATLYIDGKPAESSLKNVEQVGKSLSRELKNLEIGTDSWNRKMKEVQANKKYLQEIQNEIKGVGGAFGWLKTEVGKFGALAAGYLGFQFVTSQFQNIIMGNAKLSDSLADIRRVTGLTEQGVLNLDASLGKLDTRTSKSGLRDIAVIAGKLGVAKADILGFVEATDKLTVALGDELGNADQVTTTLGKILNVFDGEVNGDNITRLGNAMVKLANDGVASGAFIADFTQRVAGVAKSANLSLGATLAFGAGLEELGARSESSATAIQKLLLSIAADLPAAAKIAKVPLKEFTELFANKPEQALLKYTSGLVKNKAAFSDVATSLNDAGEEGARVVTTITSLGNKTQFFTDKILDSQLALQGYNEINEAARLKNETLGARVNKLGKDFNSLAQNKTLVDFLTKIVELSSFLINYVKENTEAITKFVKVILIGTSAWLGYKSALMLTSAWTVITSGYMATARVVTLLYALAQATLTGNTLRAAAAQRLLGMSMAVSPFGAILAVISALGAAYVLFSSKASLASKIQGDFNDIQKVASKKSQEEADNLKKLDAIRMNANSTLNQKIAALNKIRALYPSILDGLTNEEALTNKGTIAIRNYIKALQEKTTAEAATEKIKELKKRKLDLQQSDGSDGSVPNEIFQSIYKAVGLDSQVKRLKGYNVTTNKAEITGIDKRIKEIENQYGAAMTKQLLFGETEPTGDPTGGNNGNGKVETEAERKAAKELADKQKLRDELVKINLDIIKDQLEGFDKEVFEAELKYQKLRELALGDKDDLINLEQTKKAELDAISDKYKKQAAEKTKKEYEENYKEAVKFKEEMYHINDTAQQKEEKQLADAYEASWLINYKLYQAGAITAQEFADIELAIQKKLQEDIAKIKQDGSNKEVDARAKANQLLIESAKIVTDTVFTIMNNGQKAKTDAILADIDRQRDAELKNKKLTEKEKEQINAKFDAKVRDERQRAWKAEQRAAIAQAIINGAIAMTKVAAQTGVLSIAFNPIVALATAAQVAIIAAQKAPKFAKGGMTDKDPAGFVSSSTMYTNSASGRPFIAGEAGKEWIAPNWMVTDPRFSGIINNLEMARQDKRSFAMGGFNSSSATETLIPKYTGRDENKRMENLELMLVKLIQIQQAEMEKPIIFSQRTFEDNNAKRVQIKNDATA